jgi:hypothetical protein
MNEPNINKQNIGSALDAVRDRQQRGELIGDQSISLTSALRQRLPDLKELNRDHSASAIASALTQEGFKVSASSVQRVLQESTGTKRKPRTARISDSEKQIEVATLAPSASAPSVTVGIKTGTEAEYLLKKLREETGLPEAKFLKTVASLKTK